LYGRISEVWFGLVASGANLDDLGDYRPRLPAAKEKNVVHLLIDAGIDKPVVRAIANRLALTDKHSYWLNCVYPAEWKRVLQ
jgi:uncharacterized protein